MAGLVYGPMFPLGVALPTRLLSDKLHMSSMAILWANLTCRPGKESYQCLAPHSRVSETASRGDCDRYFHTLTLAFSGISLHSRNRLERSRLQDIFLHVSRARNCSGRALGFLAFERERLMRKRYLRWLLQVTLCKT